MKTTIELPKTLIEAVLYFSDIDRCNEYMKSIKWPDGKVTCPKCESERVGEIKTRKMLRCKDCRKQFSYKVNTIFEDSPLGLDKWFVAVWVITNAKNGVSSHELARSIGVSQKSAWPMLHRIRAAMKTKTFCTIEGTIESDEAFIGGTYISVTPKHLGHYCDEQVFRFNERFRNDAGRCEMAMKSVIGVARTWKDLVEDNGDN